MVVVVAKPVANLQPMSQFDPGHVTDFTDFNNGGMVNDDNFQRNKRFSMSCSAYCSMIAYDTNCFRKCLRRRRRH